MSLGVNTKKKMYCAEVMFKRMPYRAHFDLDQKEEAIVWLKETRARLHGDFANNG